MTHEGASGCGRVPLDQRLLLRREKHEPRGPGEQPVDDAKGEYLIGFGRRNEHGARAGSRQPEIALVIAERPEEHAIERGACRRRCSSSAGASGPFSTNHCSSSATVARPLNTSSLISLNRWSDRWRATGKRRTRSRPSCDSPAGYSFLQVT